MKNVKLLLATLIITASGFALLQASESTKNETASNNTTLHWGNAGNEGDTTNMD